VDFATDWKIRAEMTDSHSMADQLLTADHRSSNKSAPEIREFNAVAKLLPYVYY
jgi:hypothetical protein